LLQKGDSDIYQRLNEGFEKTLIQTALHYTGGRKQDAAKRLGLGRNTLTRKLKELDIQ
jgi:two-component system nitrogen regulation response regulator GlnG